MRESRKYNSFDHYLIESQKLADSQEAIEFLENLKPLLTIPKKLEFNTDIVPDEKSSFSDKIYTLFPKITMTEILYEVNSWTGILEDIRGKENTLSGKQKPLVATLMANGHNIGFSKMSISSSIDESILRRTSEFYFKGSRQENAE